MVALTAGSAMALSAPGDGILGSVHDMRDCDRFRSRVPMAPTTVSAHSATPRTMPTFGSNPGDYYPLWSRTA